MSVMPSLARCSAAVAFLFVVLLSPWGRAQSRPDAHPDAAKLADIQKLMNLTGAANLGVQAADQMIASMKGAMPTVPDKFWTEFRKELNADELVSLIIPVYDKHLTQAELKELIKFYETPVGKKMIAVMPAITAESIQIGQQWGMEVARRAKAKLDAQKK